MTSNAPLETERQQTFIHKRSTLRKQRAQIRAGRAGELFKVKKTTKSSKFGVKPSNIVVEHPFTASIWGPVNVLIHSENQENNLEQHKSQNLKFNVINQDR